MSVKAIVDAWSGQSNLQHTPHPKNSVCSSPRVQSVSLCSLLAVSPYSSTARLLSFSIIFIIPLLCQSRAQNGSQLCKNKGQTPKYTFQAMMQSIHNHLSNIIVTHDKITWTNLALIIARVFTLPPFICLHGSHFSYHSFFPLTSFPWHFNFWTLPTLCNYAILLTGYHAFSKSLRIQYMFVFLYFDFCTRE